MIRAIDKQPLPTRQCFGFRVRWSEGSQHYESEIFISSQFKSALKLYKQRMAVGGSVCLLGLLTEMDVEGAFVEVLILCCQKD